MRCVPREDFSEFSQFIVFRYVLKPQLHVVERGEVLYFTERVPPMLDVGGQDIYESALFEHVSLDPPDV